MRTDELLSRVECYVAVRKALGYAVRSEEKLLRRPSKEEFAQDFFQTCGSIRDVSGTD